MQNREPVHGAILISAAALLLSGGLVTPQDQTPPAPVAGPVMEPPTASPFAPLSLIRHKGARDAVNRASEGAARRLERPECAAVFSDFADPAGRALDERLQALGQTGPRYFRGIVYTDGTGLRRCNDQGLVAVTVPGSRVVFICGRQFTQVEFANSLNAQVVLIHEALHSLGLGENPPSARQISDRVLSRCGP